jgi:hypothetical protein
MCQRRLALPPSRSLRRDDRRAIEAGVPFAWVAADSVYGVGAVEMALRKAGKGYVLGVASTTSSLLGLGKPPVAGTAEEIMQGLDALGLARLSAGEGTKGPRLYDWAYLELADLDASEYDSGLRPVDPRPADPAQASPMASAPTSPPGARPAPASRRWSRWKGSAGHRGRFRDRKNELGSTTTKPAPGTAGTVTSRW